MSDCTMFKARAVNEDFHKRLVLQVECKRNHRVFLGSYKFVTNFTACFRQPTRI